MQQVQISMRLTMVRLSGSLSSEGIAFLNSLDESDRLVRVGEEEARTAGVQ
jgi:hypothetical protein